MLNIFGERASDVDDVRRVVAEGGSEVRGSDSRPSGAIHGDGQILCCDMQRFLPARHMNSLKQEGCSFGCCNLHHLKRVTWGFFLARNLYLTVDGGWSMRSMALLRFSLAACGSAALGIAAVQTAHLSLSLPVQHLQLAWTLTRVLIQL